MINLDFNKVDTKTIHIKTFQGPSSNTNNRNYVCTKRKWPKMKLKFSQNVAIIQSKCSKNGVKIQLKCSQNGLKKA